MAVRLLTADAVTLSRLGYAAAVAGRSDIELAGQAGDVAETLTLLQSLRPDVVAIDVELPGGDHLKEPGLRLARELRTRHPRLGLLLLGPTSDELVIAALEADLSGYLPRTAPVGILLSAVCHASVAPTSFTSPDLAIVLLRRKHSSVLSPREQEVLQHLKSGASILAIARRLHLTESTVRTYAARLYSKLDVHNRAEATQSSRAGAGF